MTTQPRPVRIAARIELALRLAVNVAGAVLTVVWGFQLFSGQPDAYPGQHLGGLMLALALLVGSAGGWFASTAVRMALLGASAACLVGAVVFGPMAR